MTFWTAIRDVFLLLSLAPFAYYLLAILAAWRFFPSAGLAPAVTLPDPPPAVSILKPICGLDRETYENYASFCRQDYPEFEILFCVSDADDPAIRVIENLIRDFPTCSIRLLTGSDPLGASDKVNKLVRMAREAKHEILVVSDSDVRVGPNFLRAIAASFADPKVGGVTCLYRGLVERCFAATLEALGNTTDFAPGVLVAWLLGNRSLDFMLGAVMATTQKHLAEIGGFESLVDYFCDDYELGNRLAARGHRIKLSRFPVSIVYPSERLPAAFHHQVRWNLSIRYSRPWGHLGLIFSQGLPWTVLAAILAPSAAIAAAYVAAYVLLRGAMAWVVGVRGMHDRLVRREFWALPVRDAFAFLVWIASFFPQRIRWRGRRFLVRKKRLVAVLPR
ncbi:MAG TPA: bacteriohopanetetrol glucosamine biosynthesis glycosyltransferase HpnI [Candidatus Acidoferrales bacterium]|nr:bacteriohopanetetrol glucosamine biosynthesis glycosyltransferase HpnI [Candidatus Acidoferrales bacterium]